MINTKIKNFIKNHALESAPNECCGFICEKNNEIFCKKINNIAENKQENFQISVNDYLEAKDNYNLLYIYHSHVNDNENFSEEDKLYSDEIAINYILYHIKSNQFKIYESNDFIHKYIGRYYQYKKYDCFTLIKDFFKNELNINLYYNPDVIQNKPLENLNILDEINKFYLKNNFVKIENTSDLIKNDILIINGFKYGSHFAIYLGDNRILHHPMNGFSKIDNYCNFYKRNTVFSLRKA